MIDVYLGKFFIGVLADDGRCCEKEICDYISYKEIYNKFKNRFSKEAIKSAWLYDSSVNDKGETLLIINIRDIL